MREAERTPVIASHAPTPSERAVVRPIESRAPRPRLERARRAVFFSLKGGSGRTTLSVELGCWLAAFGTRDTAGSAPSPLRVVVVDCDERSPSVALRLGIPQPLRSSARAPGCIRVVHRSGLQVIPAQERPLDDGRGGLPLADELARLDQDRFDVVLLDVANELASNTGLALQEADDVLVVVTPNAAGVHDAYRTTEALRRAGLRERLACVVNRARPDVDLSETLADLQLPMVAQVPEERGFIRAENMHVPLVLEARSAVSDAIGQLAAHVLRRSQG